MWNVNAVVYNDPNGRWSIELPEEWTYTDTTTKDGKVYAHFERTDYIIEPLLPAYLAVIDHHGGLPMGIEDYANIEVANYKAEGYTVVSDVGLILTNEGRTGYQYAVEETYPSLGTCTYIRKAYFQEGSNVFEIVFLISDPYDLAILESTEIMKSFAIDVTPEPATGNMVTENLWIRAVIHTEEKGSVDAVWKKDGEDVTVRGDRVVWGHFYASPSDVSWGSQNNPDLFVKIWFDVGGRIDVNFFHVSVPDIEVYSDYPYDGTPNNQGTTTLSNRYIRHEYWR